MHTPDDDTRERDDLFLEITVENVEDNRNRGPRGTIEIVIRHTDVSETISLGPWNLRGSLGRILEACEQNLPEFLCDMEARVPASRRATLPPVGFWGAVHGEGMVVPCVVRDREDE